MNFFSKLNYFYFRKGGVNLNAFISDAYAGCSVGILSMPLAIAFAIASGVRPEQGLFTALIAGIVAALFGGCRLQISGPAGTFIVLVFSTIQNYGYEGLVLATILAGIILIVMSIARFGALIKFIPYPVVIGFSSGVAVVLAVGQVPDFLGLHLSGMPKEFISKCLVIFDNFHFYNIYSVLCAVLSILLMVISPRIFKKLPGSLVAILFTSLLAFVFRWPVETIGDRFGAISPGIPSITLPYFEWKLLFELFPTAFAIALIAGIESLIASMVADGMTGTRHHSNRELFAQGLSNIASVFFQGIPSTGALSRTVSNIRHGAQSQLAAVFCSGFIACVLIFFIRWIAYIPLSALAGILMIIAYNICDWRHFSKLFKSPKSDVVVLLTTFFLTVFVNLISALEIGIILATFLFVDKASKNVKSLFLREAQKNRELDEMEDSFPQFLEEMPSEIEVFELNGPLFFAAVDNFKKVFNSMTSSPKILIIRLRYVPSIDASGLNALEDIFINTKKKKTTLFLSGASYPVFQTLKKSGFTLLCGEQYIFKTFEEAFYAAKQLCIQSEGLATQEEV